MNAAAQCDLVVFAAHPDDAELTCGGLLLVSRAKGWKTAVVDMTRGELGTRGTVAIRAAECEAAAKVLGLTTRINLGMPDGGVRDTDDGRRAVVRVIRELRPRVVVAPPSRGDHHPDHIGTGDLVQKSFYLAGIRKFLPELEPHRPRVLIHYLGSRVKRPTLIVDVSSVIEGRRAAVACHASQVGPPLPGEPPIRISHPDFLDAVDARLRYFGWTIGVRYGEGYAVETPLPVADLVGLFEIEPYKRK
jgi:N-acetylglucosamine malate deacetylase 1